jgi:hypothetical protein
MAEVKTVTRDELVVTRYSLHSNGDPRRCVLVLLTLNGLDSEEQPLRPTSWSATEVWLIILTDLAISLVASGSHLGPPPGPPPKYG